MARWRQYWPWLTGRSNTALTPGLMKDIDKGLQRYTYKGVRTMKCPFDMALYSHLLWRDKPRTIFEVGSASGGSALWLADQLKAFGIDGMVHSLDIKPVEVTAAEKIAFHTGDLARLPEIFPDAWIEKQARPFLVIDDGPHDYASARTVLNHFAAHMQPGEYLVIEDGILTALGDDQKFGLGGGPMKAVHDFLAEGAPFEIDRSYCDFFGHNVTWNVDGFLRRL